MANKANILLSHIIIIILLLAIFYATYDLRGWAANVDQEITIGYNSLLLNSKQPYEMTNHPGLLAAYFMSLVIRITHSLGITTLYGIDELNNSTDLMASLVDLAISARFTAAVSILLIAFLTYKICHNLFKSEASALLMAICFVAASGNSFHFFQLRSEPLSLYFIAASTYMFVSSLNAQRLILSNIYLFISMIFYWMSAIGKIQILCFAWLYYGWTLVYFKCGSISISRAFKSVNDFRKNAAWAVITCSLVYFAIYYYSSGVSFWLHFANYTLLLITYVICRSESGNGYLSYRSLWNFNIYFLLAGVAFTLLVTMISVNPGQILSVIANPIETLQYYATNSVAKNATSLKAMSLENIYSEMLKILWTPLEHLRKSANTHGSEIILTLISLVLFTVASRVSARDRLLVLYSLFSFGVVAIINGLRSQPLIYVIYSECFVFAIVVLLLSRVEGTNKKILGASIILLIVFMWRLPEYQSYYQDKPGSAEKQCVDAKKGGGFMFNWHHRLDHSKFLAACHQYGYI
jgi:hypothetical protein